MTDDPELPLRRLLDAVTSVGGELDLDRVLREVVRAAVSLVRARYGALGVLDPDRTYLSDFVSVGIDDDTADVIGELLKGHGILGLLIEDPRPIRLADLGGHPDRFGFPPGHPPMTSFLGVPVFVGGAAYGNLYLTDKADGGLFTDQDEELVVSLAAAAGTAIERARLHRRLRALDLVEDRERIARDLHDTVIQRLFATGLALQGAARLAAPLPEVEQRIQQAVDDKAAGRLAVLRCPVGTRRPRVGVCGGSARNDRADSPRQEDAVGCWRAVTDPAEPRTRPYRTTPTDSRYSDSTAMAGVS